MTEANRSGFRLVGFLLSAAATALICRTVWPGFMSFDSLYAYRQSIDGVETAVWPPIFDYLFYLSRTVSGGPGGLLALHCFGLLFSASLIVGRQGGGKLAFLMPLGAFIGLFLWFPTLIGTLIVLWKDVTVAAFSLIAIALWLSCRDSFSAVKSCLLFLALFVAISSRYNALPLVLPFMVLVVLDPAGEASNGRKRLAALCGAVLAISAAYCTSLWRLPDFHRLPPAGNVISVMKLWDIIGVSACEGRNLLPEGLETGERFSGEDFRNFYDHRHINLTFGNPLWKERMTFHPRDEEGEIAARWNDLLLRHTGCYLSVRDRIFAEQMGLDPKGVYYPTHGGIDPNPYGIGLASPREAGLVAGEIAAGANHPLRRIYLLYGLAVGLAAPAIRLGGKRFDLLAALGLGIIGFLAVLYIAAPACDARYFFPSNVFAALLAVLSADRLVRALRTRRGLSGEDAEPRRAAP